MSTSTQNLSQNQNPKYGSIPGSPFIPSNSNSNNILQPKRLNVVSSSENGHLTPRRILGQKGQLPVSQLSNQQLTTLLRNSPLLPHPPEEGCGVTPSGPILPTSSGPKRAPNTMAKRNARERNRVKQVNQGFQTLRQHIPESYRLKKMSKVDTLRCALDYIRNMERILQEDESFEDGSSQNQYQSHPICGDSSTVSPSTTVSFSSEEDDYLVYTAFSGDFTPSSSSGLSSRNNGNVKELEQCKPNLFEPRIILSSSNSPGYNENEENNDENLDMKMKFELQVDEQEYGIQPNSNHNPEQCPILRDHSLDLDARKTINHQKEEVGMEIGDQSRGPDLDGGSDTENNYCPEQKEIKIQYE